MSRPQFNWQQHVAAATAGPFSATSTLTKKMEESPRHQIQKEKNRNDTSGSALAGRRIEYHAIDSLFDARKNVLPAKKQFPQVIEQLVSQQKQRRDIASGSDTTADTSSRKQRITKKPDGIKSGQQQQVIQNQPQSQQQQQMLTGNVISSLSSPMSKSLSGTISTRAQQQLEQQLHEASSQAKGGLSQTTSPSVSLKKTKLKKNQDSLPKKTEKKDVTAAQNTNASHNGFQVRLTSPNVMRNNEYQLSGTSSKKSSRSKISATATKQISQHRGSSQQDLQLSSANGGNESSKDIHSYNNQLNSLAGDTSNALSGTGNIPDNNNSKSNDANTNNSNNNEQVLEGNKAKQSNVGSRQVVQSDNADQLESPKVSVDQKNISTNKKVLHESKSHTKIAKRRNSQNAIKGSSNSNSNHSHNRVQKEQALMQQQQQQQYQQNLLLLQQQQQQQYQAQQQQAYHQPIPSSQQHDSVSPSAFKQPQQQQFQQLSHTQQLILQNAKQANQQRIKKLEQQRAEEEQKRHRQQLLQLKNQQIRSLNATRFRAKTTPQNDLAKRLPWGINQEKLRNYAIQVLTQYRKQDMQSNANNSGNKRTMMEIQNGYRYDEKQRRQQIGLDNFSEEEIQRFIQLSREKQDQLFEEAQLASIDNNHSPHQQNEHADFDKEAVLQYMEGKKVRTEQEELQRKLEKAYKEQRVKENQQSLEESVKGILHRLKKTSTSSKKRQQQHLGNQQYLQSQQQSASLQTHQNFYTAASSQAKTPNKRTLNNNYNGTNHEIINHFSPTSAYAQQQGMIAMQQQQQPQIYDDQLLFQQQQQLQMPTLSQQQQQYQYAYTQPAYTQNNYQTQFDSSNNYYHNNSNSNLHSTMKMNNNNNSLPTQVLLTQPSQYIATNHHYTQQELLQEQQSLQGNPGDYSRLYTEFKQLIQDSPNNHNGFSQEINQKSYDSQRQLQQQQQQLQPQPLVIPQDGLLSQQYSQYGVSPNQQEINTPALLSGKKSPSFYRTGYATNPKFYTQPNAPLVQLPVTKNRKKKKSTPSKSNGKFSTKRVKTAGNGDLSNSGTKRKTKKQLIFPDQQQLQQYQLLMQQQQQQQQFLLQQQQQQQFEQLPAVAVPAGNVMELTKQRYDELARKYQQIKLLTDNNSNVNGHAENYPNGAIMSQQQLLAMQQQQQLQEQQQLLLQQQQQQQQIFSAQQQLQQQQQENIQAAEKGKVVQQQKAQSSSQATQHANKLIQQQHLMAQEQGEQLLVLQQQQLLLKAQKQQQQQLQQQQLQQVQLGMNQKPQSQQNKQQQQQLKPQPQQAQQKQQQKVIMKPHPFPDYEDEENEGEEEQSEGQQDHELQEEELQQQQLQYLQQQHDQQQHNYHDAYQEDYSDNDNPNESNDMNTDSKQYADEQEEVEAMHEQQPISIAGGSAVATTGSVLFKQNNDIDSQLHSDVLFYQNGQRQHSNETDSHVPSDLPALAAAGPSVISVVVSDDPTAVATAISQFANKSNIANSSNNNNNIDKNTTKSLPVPVHKYRSISSGAVEQHEFNLQDTPTVISIQESNLVQNKLQQQNNKQVQQQNEGAVGELHQILRHHEQIDLHQDQEQYQHYDPEEEHFEHEQDEEVEEDEEEEDAYHHHHEGQGQEEYEHHQNDGGEQYYEDHEQYEFEDEEEYLEYQRQMQLAQQLQQQQQEQQQQQKKPQQSQGRNESSSSQQQQQQLQKQEQYPQQQQQRQLEEEEEEEDHDGQDEGEERYSERLEVNGDHKDNNDQDNHKGSRSSHSDQQQHGSDRQNYDAIAEMTDEELELMAHEIFNNAATYIQKVWRGYLTRQILYYYFNQENQEAEMEEQQQQQYQQQERNNNPQVQVQQQLQKGVAPAAAEGVNLSDTKKSKNDDTTTQKSEHSASSQKKQGNQRQKDIHIDLGVCSQGDDERLRSINNEDEPLTAEEQNAYNEYRIKQHLEIAQKQQQKEQEEEEDSKRKKQNKNMQQEEVLNKEWLMQQEKDEFAFSNEDQQDDSDKVIHISTIKTSLVNNEEQSGQQQQQNMSPTQKQADQIKNNGNSDKGDQGKQLQQQQKKASQDAVEVAQVAEQHDEQDLKTEESQDQPQEGYDQDLEYMSDQDVENWKQVQRLLAAVDWESNDADEAAQKDKIIDILQNLSIGNRERLLLCIEENEENQGEQEEQDSFSISQILNVFRMPFAEDMEGEEGENGDGMQEDDDDNQNGQLQRSSLQQRQLQQQQQIQEEEENDDDEAEEANNNQENQQQQQKQVQSQSQSLQLTPQKEIPVVAANKDESKKQSPQPKETISQIQLQQQQQSQSQSQQQSSSNSPAPKRSQSENISKPDQQQQQQLTEIVTSESISSGNLDKKRKTSGQLKIDVDKIEEDAVKRKSDRIEMQQQQQQQQQTQQQQSQALNTSSPPQQMKSKPSNIATISNNETGVIPAMLMTPLDNLKSLERQSVSSKNSSKRDKSHSLTYEANSERSFNQMRKNHFHSPKQNHRGLNNGNPNSNQQYYLQNSSRGAMSVCSDETRSAGAVSPKEEMNQLYALLQQEHLQSRKDNKGLPKSLSARASIKDNTSNSNQLQQNDQLYQEYFETSADRSRSHIANQMINTPVSNSNYASNNLKENNNNVNANNASTSSIFDHDSFKEFTEKKMKQIMSETNINELLKMREQALQMRQQSQMNAMDQMLSQKHVSPRTYDSKKQELENWVQNEKEEISQTRKELERGLMKAMESIQKTQRDVQLAQRFKTNPSRLDSRSSFASEEEYLFRRKMENEAASSKSDSDNQSDNLSSSQALKHLLKEMGTPTDKNNIKIIDQFELKDHHREDDAKNKDNNNNEVQDDDGDNSRSKSKNQGNTNVLVLPKQQSQQAKMKMKKEPKKYADGDNEDEEEEDEDIQHREQIGQGNNSNINNNRFKDDRAKSEDSLGTNQDFQSESQEKKRDSSFDDEIAASPTQEKKIIAAADGNNSNNAVSNAAPAEGNKKLSSNKVKLVLDYNDLEHNSNSSQVDQSKKPQQEGQDSNLADPQVSSGVSNAIDNAAAQQNDKLGSDKSSQEAMTNSQKESISDQDDIDQLKFNEDSELAQERQHAFNQLSSPSAEFMERSEILAEMQDKWRTYNQIDARIQEQLQKLFSQDKSDNYGIATNLKIVTDYIQTLFNYVVDHYKQDFLDNLNTPFGFAPSKRLKLIHGYDSFVDSSCSEEGSTDDYNTLPFVLSEELFIEFEQNIIGNGETEKEQIIKEFEHIHNKAIFDTFNEALNIFRPFYTLGGPPYSWTKSEKNLVLGKASQKNLGFILEKSKARVMEWSSYLCGLVNEDEQPRQLPLEDEKGNPPPLSVLLENLTPQNEYLAQVREEKLSKMLLTEIFENEYKWQLYEDEKTEVVMELADLVFEQLVEEVVHDMSPRRNGRDAGEEEDQEGEIDGDFHGHEKEEGEEEQFGLDEFSQENLQQHDVHEDQEQHQE